MECQCFFIYSLRSFGENKYEIPVYFLEGISEQLPGCVQGEIPHSLNAYLPQELCKIWNCSDIKGKHTIISLIKSDCKDEVISQVARICNIFREEPSFHAITLPLDSIVNQNMLHQQRKLYTLPEDQWSWWDYQEGTDHLVRCGLNLTNDCSSVKKVILIDQKSRIRGIYAITDVEEVDRLVTEYRILLSES